MEVCNHLHPRPLPQLPAPATHTHTHTHTGDLTVGEHFVATLLTLPLADMSVVQILQSCSGSGRSVFVSARGILEGAELILTQNLQHSKPPVGGQAVWGDRQCGGHRQCGGQVVWGGRQCGGQAVWGPLHMYILKIHMQPTCTCTYDRNCTHTHLAN